MNAFWAFIFLILRVLLPAVKGAARDEYTDAVDQPDTIKQLKTRIRSAGWAVALALLVLPASGCFYKAIYVPHGQPVRLRETVDDVKVWVMTKGGPAPSKMDLPEGWYCLPLDDEKEAGITVDTE